MVAPEHKGKLTFEELCPKFSRIIPRFKVTQQYVFGDLDLSEPRCCVVGEAFGFDDSYWSNCQKCIDFSCKFRSILMIPPEKRQWLVNRFTAHFNRTHR